MRNIKLTLQYDGSCFHGWQQQDNADSVEANVKAALRRILQEDVKLQSCSRTDTGVHALMFCCNFKTENDIPCARLQRGLNAVLPPAVAVTNCEDVDEGFHARYACTGKRYIYRIWNSKTRNPFLLGRALHYPFALDDALLNSEAQDFVGTHDFAALCAAGSSVKSTVRTIFDCSVRRDGDLVTVSVSGDGFLYNMVRILVGTLLEINEGKRAAGSILELLSRRDRTLAGATAKAEGLYLAEVFYEHSPSIGKAGNEPENAAEA